MPDQTRPVTRPPVRTRIDIPGRSPIRVERCCGFPQYKVSGSYHPTPADDSHLAQMISCEICGAQIAQIVWEAPDNA